MSATDVEAAMSKMSDEDYELMLMDFSASTARLKRVHYISYLFNRQNEAGFHKLFDDTLVDIANYT